MRISSYQVSQVYSANNTSKATKKAITGSGDIKDQVSFSSVGRDMQVAKAALSNVPDVREDRVNSLKQSINNGTYEVSGESFADKLLAAYNEKTF